MLAEMSAPLLQSLLDSCQTALQITDWQLQPYKIKLTQPWHSATHNFQYRHGLIVNLKTRQGLTACGDCAPLTEMGTESLSQAQHQLGQTLRKLGDKTIDATILNDLSHYPASRFALETAILSLVCQIKQQSLSQLLRPNAPHTIAVNAMLGDINQQTKKRIQSFENKGFSCLKFKLGRQSPQHEARQLQQLFDWLTPETRIRLDFNKSLTLTQSQWFLHFIGQALATQTARIDSIEEPLKHYNNQYYQLLQQQTTIPLALDESLQEYEWKQDFPVRRMILKPTRLGGILKSWQIAQTAQQLGIEVVITSMIESAYGLWPICHLAAALDNHLAHGLATANWLEQTLTRTPEITHGYLAL